MLQRMQLPLLPYRWKYSDVDTGSIDTESSIPHEPQKRRFEIIGVSKLASIVAMCPALLVSQSDTMTNTIGKCSM